MSGKACRIVLEGEPGNGGRGKPAHSDPEQLSRRLAGDLDSILLMALRTEPELRYASVDRLAEDLARFTGRLPVRARQGTVLYLAGKFARRNRIGLSAAAVVVAITAGFLVTLTRQAERVASERDKAIQVTRFMVDLFGVSDPNEAGGDSIPVREVLDRGAQTIETDLADQPEVQASLLDTVGRVYRNLGLYARAVPLVEKALTLRTAALGADHRETLDTQALMAQIAYDSGDYDRAIRLRSDEVDARRRSLGSRHPDVAASLVAHASLLRWRTSIGGSRVTNTAR